MTSLAAARTRLALPVATVVNRGIALGVLATIPPLVLLGPFGFFLLVPLAVLGITAGTGAALAVALLLRYRHRIVIAAPHRGRLLLAVAGAIGAAVAVLVLLAVWSDDLSRTGVQYWGGVVVLGAALAAALNRASLIRLLASNDIASPRIRVARWMVTGGMLLIAVALALVANEWFAGLAEGIASEPHPSDVRPVIAAIIPAAVVLVVASVLLSWRLPVEVDLQEQLNAFFAICGAGAAIILLMVAIATNG